MLTITMRQKMVPKTFGRISAKKRFGGLLKTGISQPVLNQIKKFKKIELASKFSIDWHAHYENGTENGPKDVWANIR